MAYVPYNTATQYQEIFATALDGPPEQIKLLIDLLGASTNGSSSTTDVEMEELTIVTGTPNDSIDFSAYAGVKPILLMGIVGSTGTAIVLNNATGFVIDAANPIDLILLSNVQSQLGYGFNITQTLTGVGSSVSFLSGYLFKAYIIYQP